ncbi:MAG TPA: thioredoxin domain-containing protein [Terrimesophilobacter sp.]|nr:thioredoxin domain-containing protein [Terrimesophilobacter sp.]
MSTSDARPNKNERRDAAREKARQLREEQRKKDRRNRFVLQGSLILVTLAIVAIVAIAIYSAIRPPAPGPLNMLSDGIKLGEGFHATLTPALQPSEEPVPSASNEPADVLDIRVYVDYMCPVCGNFEKANADQIKQLVRDGAATLEIHPVAILDRLSMGTKYSSRASNAAACVANFSPNNFFDFSAILFQQQPEEGSAGLDDDTLVELAKEVGVSKFTNISSCIREQTFKDWVKASTDRFTNNPIPDAAPQPDPKGTPTVVVNGQLYEYTTDQQGAFDPQEFASFLVQVLGANYSESSVPSPSPSPSSSPSP